MALLGTSMALLPCPRPTRTGSDLLPPIHPFGGTVKVPLRLLFSLSGQQGPRAREAPNDHRSHARRTLPALPYPQRVGSGVGRGQGLQVARGCASA